ncbi:hypothetical protein QTP70_020662 [Hemibagrus guttatus]|uniref:Uncharacterized protein n=1 Tax=Hemibagrus guttatus TaxID=175788 RepID=A0AAE0RCQ9_9TELE|nr:hypothetical protein QTP70_020662 [Hemibagrus guttatus]
MARRKQRAPKRAPAYDSEDVEGPARQNEDFAKEDSTTTETPLVHMNDTGHYRDDNHEKADKGAKSWSKPRKRSLMEMEGKEDAQKQKIKAQKKKEAAKTLQDSYFHKMNKKHAKEQLMKNQEQESKVENAELIADKEKQNYAKDVIQKAIFLVFDFLPVPDHAFPVLCYLPTTSAHGSYPSVTAVTEYFGNFGSI